MRFDSIVVCAQILPVANTNTYTVQIISGRGGAAGCPTYLGVPACGAGAAPLLQTYTQGATGGPNLWTLKSDTYTYIHNLSVLL